MSHTNGQENEELLATVLVISDPQFFYGGTDDNVSRNNVSVLNAIRKLSALGIDFKCAIMCGDYGMVDTWDENEEMSCFLNAYLYGYKDKLDMDSAFDEDPDIDEDVFSDLKNARLEVKPVYLVLGNHDDRWKDHDCNPEVIVNKLYPDQKKHGTEFDIGEKYHIVLYDDITVDHGDNYPPLIYTLEWAKNNNRKVVVFTHNPDRDSEEWTENKNRADNYYKAIKEYPDTLLAFVGGHCHDYCGDIDYYRNISIGSNIPSLYDGAIGTKKTFLILRFYTNKIEFLPLRATDYNGNFERWRNNDSKIEIDNIDTCKPIDEWGWVRLCWS